LFSRSRIVYSGLCEVAEDGYGRDEAVNPDASGQLFRRHPHDARDVAAGIDHGVEASIVGSQLLQVGSNGSIAEDGFDAGKEAGVVPPPVEKGHVVAACQRRLDQMPAKKNRPAKNEYVHTLPPLRTEPSAGFPDN
jgi:hypothetical protein